MKNIIHSLQQQYSPLYFLAALGYGGLSITFFMYLLFMTDHKNTPIPTFNSIIASFNSGDIWTQILIIFSMSGILLFAFWHFRMLIANIIAYKFFKTTSAYIDIKTTNAEIQLMAPPLTFAMSINVLFVLGAVFIPNLWSVVEYLFPLAILGFLIVGGFAFKIFLDYAKRVFLNGDFAHDKNNNLSQMLGVFAFAMIAVGFSASSAMSHNSITSAIALVFAIFFLTTAILFGIIKLIFGLHSTLTHGIDKVSSVSLWIIIPITTLIGITLFRLTMAGVHNFDLAFHKFNIIILFSIIFSMQIIFGIMGYLVMKANGYFADFIYGNSKSPAAYALICPGVAITVLGFFFVHKVLVLSGIITMFSFAYFIAILPLVYLQFITIKTLLKLNKNNL